MSNARRLKVGLIGLGRLGSIRARILATQQPRVDFVAACDTKPGADKWAAENLPATVKFFADPADLMKNSGVEAVLIATATATHAPLVVQALDLGLHVMCEKPISTDIVTTEEVLAKVASKPNQVFLLPFSKRYDPSYRATRKLIDDGALGEVHAIESHNADQQDPTGFFVTFSALSGGIFIDVGIHDIDIARYFLDPKLGLKNPKKQVNRVFAVGQNAVYGDLAKFGDVDNGWGMVEFANGKILTVHLGRTLTNGYEASTRVYGTKAHSIVNGNSTLNRIEIRDQYGVRTATTPDAFALYDRSFVNDIAEFANAVLDGSPLTCTPEDAYEAAKIVAALRHSYQLGQPVLFDDDGRPILQPLAKTNGH
ncbi:NAD binding Rossmann fold oxidoreductase [Niveomyces insectorum RCEF 264]|uniref:NAD binding Rossmann fold oxidoreductase n=1 Tax=Niveomyces insectorum RCEF 264 TaxID=1081102 RepID=A0A167SLB6_9HYPO|nr:NAD binding Rossmann fold oxidoreductase [Niveomyces insectorum RCEF 264]